MATSAQIPVPTGVTPTALAAPAAASDSHVGDTLLLFNAGTVTVYLGGSNVSTSNGFRGLVAGATLVLDVDPGDGLYGVVSGGTAGAVDVLRVR